MADELPELAPYDFTLPEDAIAQAPLPERDASRMLVLERAAGRVEHAQVSALPAHLRAGDLLVVNRTRVVAAKLRGCKQSGGRAEALLLGPVDDRPGRYRALVRSGGRLRPGLGLRFAAADAHDGTSRSVEAQVEHVGEDGEVVLAFASDASPYEIGEPPLPPYIRRRAGDASIRAHDRERYQTIFADEEGAVAAPTAGLHLTERLLAALEPAGIELASLVLHVGLGTFRPLRAADWASGRLHRERFDLPVSTAEAIERTRARGGRVIAVGTTTTRVLEARACGEGRVEPGRGETDLFLRPGDRFAVVDGLLTNFHLPRSSLLLLVCALAGREAVLDAYGQALARGYRFYSYGDAMLVL